MWGEQPIATGDLLLLVIEQIGNIDGVASPGACWLHDESLIQHQRRRHRPRPLAVIGLLMSRSSFKLFQLALLFFLLIACLERTWSAEITVQIRSPNSVAQITQEQDYLLVSEGSFWRQSIPSGRHYSCY